MNKRLYNALIIIFLSVAFIPATAQNSDEKSAITFNSLRGNWELNYENSYGYSFRFGKNYKSIIIVYFNSGAVIFKGIYNVEDSETFRINISEMKHEEKQQGLNLKTGFVRVKSSYFIFKGKLAGTGNSRKLELRPITISINGSDSEGYFEPLIELTYSGK